MLGFCSKNAGPRPERRATSCGGRAFYTALGHLPQNHSDQMFLHHLYGGIYWAATGRGFRAK